MLFWLGLIVVALTFVGIVKKFDAKMSLFLAGAVMCCAAGHPLAAIDTFTKLLTQSFLVPIIACAMGFACIMSLTECDKHFSFFALRYLLRVKKLLVPMSFLLIWLFSNAINSPAGLAAAVAPIIVPVLMRAGIPPAMAAATVLLGTWGEFTSVSSGLAAVVGSYSGHDVPTLVLKALPASLTGLFVSMAVITITALMRKEMYASPSVKGGADAADAVMKEVLEFKVNYLKALMPIMPIIILILGTDQVGLIYKFSVPQAMIICTALTLLVCRFNPFKAVKSFCNGMGESFGSIVALIAAAGVFTAGMTEVGIISTLIEAMKNSADLAKVSASWATFLLAALSGSGDAATLAFNTAITPHAASFGLDSDLLGMTAYLGAALGRTASPVAGVALICAGVAKVDPFELAKRTAPACIATNLCAMAILSYILQ